MAYVGNAPYQGVLTGGNIQDGTVETTDLADQAVTTAKMHDQAVTAGKLHNTLDLSDKTLTLPAAAVTAHAPVSSVNGQTGAVTVDTSIDSSDVTTALGYTPVDKAGDTMTGNLTLQKASGNTSVAVATSNANGAINAIEGFGVEIATDGTNKFGRFRVGTASIGQWSEDQFNFNRSSRFLGNPFSNDWESGTLLKFQDWWVFEQTGWNSGVNNNSRHICTFGYDPLNWDASYVKVTIRRVYYYNAGEAAWILDQPNGTARQLYSQNLSATINFTDENVSSNLRRRTWRFTGNQYNSYHLRIETNATPVQTNPNTGQIKF